MHSLYKGSLSNAAQLMELSSSFMLVFNDYFTILVSAVAVACYCNLKNATKNSAAGASCSWCVSNNCPQTGFTSTCGSDLPCIHNRNKHKNVTNSMVLRCKLDGQNVLFNIKKIHLCPAGEMDVTSQILRRMRRHWLDVEYLGLMRTQLLAD